MPHNKPNIWKAGAVVPSSVEEPLEELLINRFGAAVTSYSDFETGETSFSIFLTKRSDWGSAGEDLAREWLLVRGRSCRLSFPAFHLTRLKHRDWADVWKRHFKPLKVSRALLVRPPWARCPVVRGRQVVVLEPGLSFGTGHHPTTAFCLREIVRYRPVRVPRSFLDIGTGSGILAISAAKLGYRPIDAFDLDPESIRIALQNASRNKVGDVVQPALRDLAKLPVRGGVKYDLICANLISNVLLAHRDRIISRLQPGGVVVLAGILATEFEGIRRAFESAGFQMLRNRTEKEWCSGSFARKG